MFGMAEELIDYIVRHHLAGRLYCKVCGDIVITVDWSEWGDDVSSGICELGFLLTSSPQGCVRYCSCGGGDGHHRRKLSLLAIKTCAIMIMTVTMLMTLREADADTEILMGSDVQIYRLSAHVLSLDLQKTGKILLLFTP